jgi:uncharacterized RDD family membrane protein YckC
MQLACTHCRQVLEFSGQRPSFCAYCGKPLATPDPQSTADFDHEARTQAPAQSGADDASDPTEVGGYRLHRLLGEGGMGKVYEAEDPATGRRVALKLIAAEYVSSPDAVERFRREGRLASALSHPRCVFVLAADEEGGRPYIVMELMQGNTLEDLLKREGPLSVEQAITKVLDVIEGLQEAHRLGVVHRDVKPSNCFLDLDGRVKVGDFGLAKSLVGTAQLTRTGSFIGTPLFASPEQIKGDATGPHSDVYSVAATLYCLLTGRAPFQGGDPAATLARIVSDPPPPMRSLRPDLPAALDKVVLRGLERDRDRRWRDLDEFRAALLPFLPGRLSFGGLGVRYGAYLIDNVFLMFLLQTTWLTQAWIRGTLDRIGEPTLENQFWLQLMVLVGWLVYFGVPEAIWSCSLGKRFLGLRVVKSASVEPPGLLQILVRTVLFTLLLHADFFAIYFLIRYGVIDPRAKTPQVQMSQGVLILGVVYSLLAAGFALMVCTMRARNGYRGLHEWLSGTRVIRLPEAETRRALGSRCSDLAVCRSADQPERVGSFDILGAVWVDGSDMLLFGQDPALGRKAFLWLRPGSASPLSHTRRDVGRTTRLRWLAGGQQGDQLWDAFLAPAGHSLPEVITTEGKLSWADGRYLLTQLAEELCAAELDGTLPSSLTVDQVWVQADGRLQLLDVAVSGTERQGDALSLLRDVAILSLEGNPRPAGDVGSIRAPLPRYAARLLDRLVGAAAPYQTVQEFQGDLTATADKPTAISRGRRLAHLAVLAALLSFGLGFGWLVLGFIPSMTAAAISSEMAESEQIRADLLDAAAVDLGSALHTDPFTRCFKLQQLEDDLNLRRAVLDNLERQREERNARRELLSGIGRVYSDLMEKQAEQARVIARSPARYSPSDRVARARDGGMWVLRKASTREDDIFDIAIFETWMLTGWPVVWIVWAFLWRGGLSFRFLGLALVRGDGQPAGRFQCAWRATLVWVLPVALGLATAWLESEYWMAWRPGVAPGWMTWLAWLTWWTGVLLFPLYMLPALWSPGRSLHDRLAGTYLVPR